MMLRLLHIAMMMLPTVLFGQERILSRDLVLRLVANNHPVARQAALRPAMGDAAVRSARGAFDPVALAGYGEKRFQDKDYYELFDAGLRVPTWFGVELFGGYSSSGGDLLNPQNTLPGDGQVRVGATVQVGQGLLIDRRRAELRQAQAYQDMAEAERQRLLNEVFHAALSDHVDWVAAFNQLLVARAAVEQAQVRFQAVRGNFRGGDVPAIDTLEALLQVQDRRMRMQDAELAFQVAGLRLSNHLWDEALRPLEIGAGLVPDTTDLAPPADPPLLDTLIDVAARSHPDLIEREGRLRQLQVERRLRAEMLKPRLDLSGSLLSTGGVLTGEGDPSWRVQDRQLGASFSMPLLLRRERGDLSLAGLRLTDAELALDRQRQVVRNQVDQRYNEVATLQQQVALGSAMVRNYQGLLNGENNRFALGESSLFLVNQREVALLDSQLKLVDLEAKRRKAFFTLERDAGILWQVIQQQLARP